MSGCPYFNQHLPHFNGWRRFDGRR